MSNAQKSLLAAFVDWASAHQRRLINDASAYVATLQVGRATNNRAVTFKIERFKVESTGWIGNEIEQGGVLTVWENGCADAEWADIANLTEAEFSPDYQEHWDDLGSDDFTGAFSRFTNKFEGP